MSDFFDSPQGAAVLKHGVMRRYPAIFASMTGSRAPDHRVVIADCYAGPGTYTDGTPGSPGLIAATSEALAKIRNVHGIYVEADTDLCNELATLLKSSSHESTVLCSAIEECLDEVLNVAGTAPAFFFLDPFGIGAPFDDVVRVLNRAGPDAVPGPPTEILLNFSTHALRRHAGHLRSQKDYPAKETIIARVDQWLGGDWWHEIAAAEAVGWMDEVLEGYLRRLRDAAGAWSWFAFEVYDREGGPVEYQLVFLTRRMEGIWHFNGCLSLAQQDFRKFSTSEGQLDFEEGLNKSWEEKIEKKLETMLEKGPVQIAYQLGEILGVTDMLGLAREKHIRVAAKRLFERGLTVTNVKGMKSLFGVELRPPKK